MKEYEDFTSWFDSFKRTYESTQRLDLKTNVCLDGEWYMVSTVDLGIPVLGFRYETMVFKADGDMLVSSYDALYMQRYLNEEKARRGHEETINRLSDLLKE